MYHSITFDEKNTWEDWRLIPSSLPIVAPPEVKEKFVDLPGGHGSIDLTEFLGGEAKYGMREGTWEFILHNDHQAWDILYSEILAYLHGKRRKVILEDDSLYYYVGRVKLDEAKCQKTNFVIAISYTLEPFKHALDDSEDKL